MQGKISLLNILKGKTYLYAEKNACGEAIDLWWLDKVTPVSAEEWVSTIDIQPYFHSLWL